MSAVDLTCSGDRHLVVLASVCRVVSLMAPLIFQTD